MRIGSTLPQVRKNARRNTSVDNQTVLPRHYPWLLMNYRPQNYENSLGKLILKDERETNFTSLPIHHLKVLRGIY